MRGYRYHRVPKQYLPYLDWCEEQYAAGKWDKLTVKARHYLMKVRMPPCPDTCPKCGKNRPELWNKSGKHLNDVSDYIWLCRSCVMSDKWKWYRAVAHPPKRFEPKPWSEISGRSRAIRIRKLLPKPDTCPKCNSTKVELCSWSGLWLEDVTDYIWLCRAHRALLLGITPRPGLYAEPSPAPAPAVDPYPDRSSPDPELVDCWYYKGAAGSVQEPSILDQNCLFGRFF